MHYLFAEDGEPVIPNFPGYTENTFRGINTAKEAGIAFVRDDETTDPDALLSTLIEKYPSLPEGILRSYVLETAMAASVLESGTRVYFNTRSSELFYISEFRHNDINTSLKLELQTHG